MLTIIVYNCNLWSKFISHINNNTSGFAVRQFKSMFTKCRIVSYIDRIGMIRFCFTYADNVISKNSGQFRRLRSPQTLRLSSLHLIMLSSELRESGSVKFESESVLRDDGSPRFS